jgi:hypothetical protein
MRQLGQEQRKVYALTRSGLGGQLKLDRWMQSVLFIMRNAALPMIIKGA